MKSIIIVVFLTLFSCKQAVKQEKSIPVQEVQIQETPESIALDFINDYVEFCNSRNTETSITEWLVKQPNVSERYKKSISKMISDAEKEDPEQGLDYDPIFDAQDYPEEGFEWVESSKNPELVIVKGKNWEEFVLKIWLEQSNGECRVDSVYPAFKNSGDLIE